MNILLAFSFPFVAGLILAPLFKVISAKTGKFVDSSESDELKIHSGRISILGGLAMVLSVSIIFIFLGQKFPLATSAISIGSLLFFLICFWDDFKWKPTSKSHPFLKSLMLFSAALISSIILYFSGISFVFFPVAIVSVILSFIYIFIVTNSINYQDGADGLAGGMVSISLIGLAILGVLESNNLVLYVSLAVLGGVLSFLIFNFPPAKIFMGDSGAYALGFILAALAMFFSKPYNIYSALGPIFIIGVPAFDGVFSNLRRMFSGRSIFFGDRNHLYDKFLKKFSIRKTLLISYSLQIVSVALGLIIYTYA